MPPPVGTRRWMTRRSPTSCEGSGSHAVAVGAITARAMLRCRRRTPLRRAVVASFSGGIWTSSAGTTVRSRSPGRWWRSRMGSPSRMGRRHAHPRPHRGPHRTWRRRRSRLGRPRPGPNCSASLHLPAAPRQHLQVSTLIGMRGPRLAPWPASIAGRGSFSRRLPCPLAGTAVHTLRRRPFNDLRFCRCAQRVCSSPVLGGGALRFRVGRLGDRLHGSVTDRPRHRPHRGDGRVRACPRPCARSPPSAAGPSPPSTRAP